MATKSAKRQSQIKRWCFTLNNYSDEDVARVKSFCVPATVHYAVVGKEVGESGTHHLQSFFRLRKGMRITELKKALGSKPHFEMARGTDAQNQEYCTKDANVLLELGTPQKGSEKGGNPRGEHVLAAARKRATGTSITALLDSELGETAVTHLTNIETAAKAIKLDKKRSVVTELHSGKRPLRWWQRNLAEKLLEGPNDWTIIWIRDSAGAKGRTWMTKELLCCDLVECAMFENGKKCRHQVCV